MIEDLYKMRKNLRKIEYKKNFGKKMVICAACSGTGKYDWGADAKCSACEGRGKIKPE